MRDIVAYLDSLRQVPPPERPDTVRLAGDTLRGALLYRAQCARCHAASGAGGVAPAVFGRGSYSVGAGMARQVTLATFLRWNMPYDLTGTLPAQDAADIAAWVLRRPEVNYGSLLSLRGVDGVRVGGAGVADATVAEQVEISLKYAGYIARQADEIAKHISSETTVIPAELDYDEVRGLSHEVRQKLKTQRPATVGQAARMSGVTPAAVSLLLVHLKRRDLSAGSARAIALRVEGVIEIGGRRRAIIRREGAGESVRVSEGDMVEGWTVRSIASERVVLVSPSGELVLPTR
jgi:hypothetical protein